MEQFFQCGITHVNGNEPSLFSFDLDHYVTATTSIDPGVPSTASRKPEKSYSFDPSEDSIDSGLGLDGGKSPKATIHGQEYDSGPSSRPTFAHDSPGKDEFSAGIPIRKTYQCKWCNKSAQSNFHLIRHLARHLRRDNKMKHETTDHVQQLSSPAANETVSESMNQPQEPSTPPEPGYNSQISSNATALPSQRAVHPSLDKGNSSALSSESTDSGDTEMHADEESLFDDHDAHLYTERKWDEATIQRLEHIYRQRLYSLVDSQVLRRCKEYQANGTSSRRIPVPLYRSRTGCLNCRKHRVECGEERPTCNNCIRSGRICEGYTQRVIFKEPLGTFGAYNSPSSGMKMEKRVLTVFDGQRRLWKDEIMLDNEFDVRLKLPGGAGDGTNREAYITDLDVETLKRAEGVSLNALMRPMPSEATAQSTSDSTGSAGEQDITRQGSDATSSARKRKADVGNDDHGDPYEGDGDGNQEPSKQFKASIPEDRVLRFACPFFKRHPESFRTCGMSDHENSSRVKQHISRKHRMPIYCPRCSETFKTEHERDTHVRDADCPVGPKADFICATAEQLRKLSRRNTHQTDRENWNAIYKILFPDDPLPESPYLDPLVSHEVNLIREAFLTAAPVAVRAAIQQVIPGEFSDSLEEELQRVLQSTHAEVFDQILRRMREDREAGRVQHTTQSLLQTRVSSTPDSGIGSTVRSGSSQDEHEPTANSQDRLTSFASGLFDLQNDGAIPLPPLFGPGFEPSEYHMGNLPQSFPDGTFDDLSEYLDAPGDSFLTDPF